MSQLSIASFFKPKKVSIGEDRVVLETKSVPQNSPTSVVEDCFVLDVNDELSDKNEKL